MFEELNQKLAAAKEKGRLQSIWKERLGILQEELKAEQHKASMWEEQLRKEEKDVEKLTGISLSALFYSLLQKKEEKLISEQLEILEAKVKYEEAVRSEADISGEIQQLQVKLKEVQYWDIESQEIFKQKEKIILQTGADKSKTLLQLADQQADWTVKAKELKEAVYAGQSVLEHLNQAYDILQSARNWGTYDLLGGGTLATHIKNNKIDEAMEHIHLAQSALGRFEKELKDVQVSLSIGIDISGFLRFSDYFFDGFISDWLVQGKINDTLQQVTEKQEIIGDLLNQLQNEWNHADRELATVKRNYSSLIETANDAG